MKLQGKLILIAIIIVLVPLSISANKKYEYKLNPLLTDDKLAMVGLPVYIRIFKKEGILELYAKQQSDFQLVDSYPICTYSGKLGPKLRLHDKQSPEGFYITKANMLNPYSQYHLSFRLNYPNQFDKNKGNTGGLIMIHGGCASKGCYAMGDKNIEEIYYFIAQALQHGQSYVNIHVFPFRMTKHNMSAYANSTHYAFWQQLQPAFEFFEMYKRPPEISVAQGKYTILSTTQ